ncbi:Predicted amidohydrolase [Actinopolymorpha cephalotaxi]|uniref:Amidohydrolase n=1 Tax=Actinopolymorpha cephalotaxi TaxID=504797 RepID=A0A1I2WUV1_9ACTN|nr:carbon-nitrogen hydrolase family protein [Actinopolymorpha cephalotaxi]NYH85139.1 putative amidohydrolase [Actinopolymorpha cephalotaxi]SFH05075.1 Predicted amidohydrolase [Actinopolymorpha cephalotaxi]
MTAERVITRLPRKVVVGTTIFGGGRGYPGLAERARELSALVDRMAVRAKESWDGHGLDLAVLPEAVLTPDAELPADRSIGMDDEVLDVLRETARRHRTYLIVPLDLREPEPSPAAPAYSNAAVLLDRQGEVAGTYRKMHPVGVRPAETLEGGVEPGREVPVFECDFGRLGIQICWDVVYDDGWAELARHGAEIVAWPSASPATVLTAAHAARHRYHIVSSTPRDNATIYEPTGMVASRITEADSVLVHQVDLSHVLLGWSPALREGAALRETYGDRVGFHYSTREDIGLFWSNDPDVSIDEMIGSFDLEPIDAQIARNLAQRSRAHPA